MQGGFVKFFLFKFLPFNGNIAVLIQGSLPEAPQHN